MPQETLRKNILHYPQLDTILIENGYAVNDVQVLLGHKSPETTMISLHASGNMINVRSPLD